MPTGWRSEYLQMRLVSHARNFEYCKASVPRGDLERRSKDLCADEFGHGEYEETKMLD